MRSHAKASSVESSSGLGRSSGSSRPGLFVILCLALALLAALTASPALAEETHPYTGISFGPKGTEAGSSFSKVGAVAVDPATNDVYVYDWPAEKLYKFDFAGNPVNFSGLGASVIEGVAGGCCAATESEVAVAPPGSPGGTAGDIYVASGSNFAVLVYGADGKPLGKLELPGLEPCGVATDPAGHVFVGYYLNSVREFIPTTNPVKNTDQSGASSAAPEEVCNVAADGLGNVYAVDFNFFRGVFKLEGLEAASATEIDPTGRTLTVDPATNDVYIDHKEFSAEASVAQYNSSGNLVNVFGTTRLSDSIGLAVNGASGKVYVGNGGSQRVDVFGPLGIAPGVKAEAASAINPKTATIEGTVNPDGVAVTGCKFEYGTTTAYGKEAPCEGAIPTDESDHPVTAALSGLSPETEYHFRLAATNANGSNESADQTFKTASAALTGEATAIAGTKATLNGIVFPEGEAVSECFFEYGTTESYGKTVACEGATPPDEGEHPVTAAITHLVPNGTKYHFRLAIKRPSGTSKGKDASFETKETVITSAASASTPTIATIKGSLNPEGIPYTECKFEYGLTEAYGSTIACAESPATIGEGTSPVSVHADLSGLSVGATYHYRILAANVDGTAKGKDHRLGPPLIEDQQAHDVTDTEAELVAKINPNGLPTTYHLEYGTTASYGQSTAEAEVGADETGHELARTLEGLEPDTTYHWRAVATNAHGESKGIDRSFATFPTFVPETGCPNQALRQGASAALPDCRAYEMVSPATKLGEVFAPWWSGGGPGGSCTNCLPDGGENAPMMSSSDGGAVVYAGQPFFAGLASGQNEYLSRRTADGWSTQSLSSPLFEAHVGGYRGVSPDLSQSVVLQSQPALSPEAPTKEGKGYTNLYLRDESGDLQPLVTEAPPHREPGVPSVGGHAFRIVYGGANSGAASQPAFTHLVFEANDALTGEVPGTAPAAPEVGASEECVVKPGDSCDIYEWVDGQLRLVNVLPGNATAAGAVIGSGRLLELNQYEGPDFDHAISADGSRIFWSNGVSGQVYVRIDGKRNQGSQRPRQVPHRHRRRLQGAARRRLPLQRRRRRMRRPDQRPGRLRRHPWRRRRPLARLLRRHQNAYRWRRKRQRRTRRSGQVQPLRLARRCRSSSWASSLKKTAALLASAPATGCARARIARPRSAPTGATWPSCRGHD